MKLPSLRETLNRPLCGADPAKVNTADLPPGCRIVDGTLTIRNSFAGPVFCWIVIALAAVLEAQISHKSGGSASIEAFFMALVAVFCAVLWPLSLWRGFRFDLRRRTYEQTTLILPVLRRVSRETDEIAGIYSSSSGRSIWMVPRSAPKRKLLLTTFPLAVPASASRRWAATLGEALGVPSGTQFLAQFPERNPRFSRYDSEQIAFRKHPLQRLVAAVFSKAFALASLVASGGITFALVRHIPLPTHFSLTTNAQGLFLSGIALLLLYAAGPQDVAFDLADGTYKLSTGLLYFARIRTGLTAQDLRCVRVLNSSGFVPVEESDLPSRNGGAGSGGSQAEFVLFLIWMNGKRTPVGSFVSRGEALAHGDLLAADLGVYCLAPQRPRPGR